MSAALSTELTTLLQAVYDSGSNGDPVGYYINYTSGTERPSKSQIYAVTEHTSCKRTLLCENLTGPTIYAWNMTMASEKLTSAGAISEWTLALKLSIQLRALD